MSIKINDWEGWLEYNGDKMFNILKISKVYFLDEEIRSFVIDNKVELCKSMDEKTKNDFVNMVLKVERPSDLDNSIKFNNFVESITPMELSKFTIKLKTNLKERPYLNKEGGSVSLSGNDGILNGNCKVEFEPETK